MQFFPGEVKDQMANWCCIAGHTHLPTLVASWKDKVTIFTSSGPLATSSYFKQQLVLLICKLQVSNPQTVHNSPMNIIATQEWLSRRIFK